MPLAAHVSVVTACPQHFGNRHALAIQLTAVAIMSAIVRHVTDAGLMRVKSREQCRARGTTARRIVKLREPNALPGQTVQIRRLNLTAVTTDVRETHVVGHNQQDVRTLSRECRRNAYCEKKRNTYCSHPRSTQIFAGEINSFPKLSSTR
jgi:acid phosphatase family membrane protein YuiD